MFTAIASFLASGAGGGIFGTIFGFIGNAINQHFTLKSLALKYDHEEKMIDKTTEAAIKEAEANMEIKRVETQGKIDTAEMDAFNESIKSDQKDLFDKSYMQYIANSKWLSWVAPLIALGFAISDMLKKSVRPVVTYYFIVVSTWLTVICYKLFEVSGGNLPVEDLRIWLSAAIFTIFSITTTCVTWHFGDRRAAKNMNRLFGLKEDKNDIIF